MTAPLRLGIAGLGHVGSALVGLVQKQGRLGLPREIEIAGVSARDRSRDRIADISPYAWHNDPSALAAAPGIDIFVELMGGADGAAKRAVEVALANGKPVVTANKALLAEHGASILAAAGAAGVPVRFEAAIAGGVPVVRAVQESLAGTRLNRISGILNGTCNYLTTEMLASGRSYETVLADAQRLGFAEADPFLDVSGTDAAHKIALLASVGLGAPLDLGSVRVRGVDTLSLQDLSLADTLGFTIKLLADARRHEGGGCTVSVEPVALGKDHPLARVGGALNTVRIVGEGLGAITLTGPGAGPGPTASAVMGDIVSLSGRASPLPTIPTGSARPAPPRTETLRAYLLSLRLEDRAGALAALSSVLAKHDLSVDRLHQDAGVDGLSGVAIVLHETLRERATAALEEARAGGVTSGAAHVLPIEAAA